jgi:hypothetical protein
MTCGAGAGGTGLWCLEAPPALSVVSVPSGMSHDASSRVATSKALRGWPEVAARRIGCWSCRLFIRNSSAIHPQFIRNSSAIHRWLRPYTQPYTVAEAGASRKPKAKHRGWRA